LNIIFVTRKIRISKNARGGRKIFITYDANYHLTVFFVCKIYINYREIKRFIRNFNYFKHQMFASRAYVRLSKAVLYS